VLQHRFPGRRPWKVELFAGAPGDPAARQYFDGAISVLRPMMASGTIAVPSGQTSFAACATMGGNSAVAQVRMDNLLAGYYGNARIDGALSPDDHLSGGIIASLTGVGYGADVLKMPIVTGLGCGIAAVRQIIAGKLWSSIFKDSRVLARATGKLVDRVLSGGPAATGGAHYDNGSEKVPALLMNPVAVDATNWKRLLVASGYYRITQLQ
jgi:putative multiple sugar transport system substrate-binding protein